MATDLAGKEKAESEEGRKGMEGTRRQPREYKRTPINRSHA